MPTTRHAFDRWLAGEEPAFTPVDDDYAAAPVDDSEPEPFYCRTCDTETLDRVAHAHGETRTVDVGTLRLTPVHSRSILTTIDGSVDVAVGAGFDDVAAAVLTMLVDTLDALDWLPLLPAPDGTERPPQNVRGKWHGHARVMGGVDGQFVRYDATLTARRRRPIGCRFTVRAADVRAVAS